MLDEFEIFAEFALLLQPLLKKDWTYTIAYGDYRYGLGTQLIFVHPKHGRHNCGCINDVENLGKLDEISQT